jgi:hypothetical protein
MVKQEGKRQRISNAVSTEGTEKDSGNTALLPEGKT